MAAAVELVHTIGGPSTRSSLSQLAHFLAIADAKELRQMASAIRTVPAYWATPWSALTPGRAADLVGIFSDPTALLVLLSMHRDGFIREQALADLVKVERPLALGATILRLSDWVPQVRDRAIDAVRQTLRSGLDPFVPWLSFFAGAQDPRLDQIDRTIDGLIRAAPEADILALFAHSDRTVRRYVASLLAETLEVPSPAIWNAAIHQDDRPTSAILCCTALERDVPAEYAIAAIESTNPAVRSSAVWRLATSDHQRAVEAVDSALADRASPPRSTAQLAVSRRGADSAAMYRAWIDEGQISVAIVLGLGETGSLEDRPQLLGLLTDSRPRIRAAAARAIGRFSLDLPTTAVMLQLLKDPSPRVAKMARQMLTPTARGLDCDVLWSLVGTAEPAHTSVLAFDLLCAPDRWCALDASLRVLSFGPGELIDRAVRHCEMAAGLGLGASFRPTAAQRTRIATHLSGAERHLTPSRFERLSFTIAPWVG